METGRHWVVTLQPGVRLCVRPTLEQMSTYVLLEQEDWFEDEIGFVRRLAEPDMLALDIGANHGVYALSLAAAGARRVIAFEPTRGAGEMLAAAIAENGFGDRVTWIAAGLSDREGEARIATGLNTELSSLSGEGEASETIRLMTLDRFIEEQKPGPVTFVKLDVEGEERAVLRGGRRFFSSQSPVVMFELKHGGVVNEGLIEDFRALGYDIYRLIPGARALAPFEEAGSDGFLLNLFAVKPDRADILAQRGRLARGPAVQAAFEAWGYRQARPAVVLERLARQPWTRPFGAAWQARRAQVPAPFWLALEACLEAGDDAHTAAERVAALAFALEATAELSRSGAGDLAVWLLRLFALDQFGLREAALELAGQLLGLLAQGSGPAWPFLPPLSDYAALEPAPPPAWLAAALQEFLLRRRSFSSYFAVDERLLAELLANPFHSPQTDRIALLLALRRGGRPAISPAHPLFDDERSANALLWRELVFGRLPRAVRERAGKVAVVDVGASSHGRLTEPYAPLILLDAAQVTGFEPDEQECQKLSAMYGGHGTFRFIPAFVGRGGEAKFHETNWFMTGSLYPPNVPLLERFLGLGEVVRPVAEHAVRTVALKDVSGLGAMDMLKIDVQGAELDVFQGAGTLLEQALLIWTEVEFVPLYKNQPLFAEVDSFLRGKGFSFFAFDGIASRPLGCYATATPVRGTRMQALWADAIFVRDTERWQDLSTEQLAKLAVLLDLVVDAPDYCHRALTLIDQREGTRFAAEYVAGSVR